MNSKTILYLTTDLLFSDTAKSGGAAVQQSQLSIFFELGYTVKVLYVNCNEFSKNAPRLFVDNQKVLFKGESISVDEVHLFRPNNSELNLVERLGKMLFNPTEYYYNFVNSTNKIFLDEYLSTLEFSFVWSQWFYAGLLTAHLKNKYKVFYVHHDWQYKLISFKNSDSLKTKFLTFSKKRVEEKLVKAVSAVVCVSSTDKDYLSSKGISSMFLTTTYDDLKINLSGAKQNPSLMHLGSLNTTANRVGLKNFILNSWKDIKQKLPSIILEVVGELPANDIELVNLLKGDSNIVLHNFVDDLNEVMSPMDIHIIPWDKDTGTRTRLAVILQYKQCLVARKEGVANANEIIHDKNSLLSDSWEGFSNDTVLLYQNNKLRKRLANDGFETYNKNYTHVSQLKKVKNFIEDNL